jgi:hypothetical protein
LNPEAAPKRFLGEDVFFKVIERETGTVPFIGRYPIVDPLIFESQLAVASTAQRYEKDYGNGRFPNFKFPTL